MKRATAAASRLGERELAGAVLLGIPASGEVAVHVAVVGLVDLHVDAVVVVDEALGVETVVGAALLAGLPLDHQAVVHGTLLPFPERVRDAHGDDVTVAVDVLGLEAAVAIRAREVAAVAAPEVVGRLQRELGAVGVDPRQHVEDLLVDEAGDLLVAAVVGEELVDGVERHGRGGVFLGVDLGVQVVAGLAGAGSGGGVGDLHEPHVAAPEALPDRAQRGQPRVGGGERPQLLGELCVVVVAVEAGGDAHAPVPRRAAASTPSRAASAVSAATSERGSGTPWARFSLSRRCSSSPGSRTSSKPGRSALALTSAA
jgi:hypothetical protein